MLLLRIYVAIMQLLRSRNRYAATLLRILRNFLGKWDKAIQISHWPKYSFNQGNLSSGKLPHARIS